MKHLSVLILFVLALACHTYTYVPKYTYHNNRIDSTISGNTDLEKLVNPYKLSLDSQMNEVLNWCDTPMTKARPEGLLGNFFADACFQFTQGMSDKSAPIDFALFNHGGLRTSLPNGPITRGKLFELMPFENELVLVTLSGRNIKKMLEYIKMKGGEPVSNIQIVFENQEFKSVLISNQPFDSLKNYTVLTSDYLASGGDQMSFFNEPIRYTMLNIKIRDALIAYTQEQKHLGKSISSKLDGRIIIKP